jgi:hypothetical protein
MAKKSRGGRMTAAKKRAAKVAKGKRRVKIGKPVGGLWIPKAAVAA